MFSSLYKICQEDLEQDAENQVGAYLQEDFKEGLKYAQGIGSLQFVKYVIVDVDTIYYPGPLINTHIFHLIFDSFCKLGQKLSFSMGVNVFDGI